MANEIQQHNRKVCRPAMSMDECFVCRAQQSLRLCSACGEKVYCSVACQKGDWLNHKTECKKTERVDLGKFYPFLATLIDAPYFSGKLPEYIPLCRQVIRGPNVYDVRQLPDGSPVTPVILEEPAVIDLNTLDEWWSDSEDYYSQFRFEQERKSLYFRIMRQGWAIPNLVSVCIALLSELFTYDASPESGASGGSDTQGMRLEYRGAPIIDFGIVRGKLDINHKGTLAFFNRHGELVQQGHHYNEHYWLYFINLKGDQVILDCGLYPYKVTVLIPTVTYRKEAVHQYGLAPAFFRDKFRDQNLVDIHIPIKRFSVLHNPDLHTLVETSSPGWEGADMSILWKFMKEVAGREPSEAERHFAKEWLKINCGAFQHTQREKSWTTWPDKPNVKLVDEWQTTRITLETVQAYSTLISRLNNEEITQEKAAMGKDCLEIRQMFDALRKPVPPNPLERL